MNQSHICLGCWESCVEYVIPAEHSYDHREETWISLPYRVEAIDGVDSFEEFKRAFERDEKLNEKHPHRKFVRLCGPNQTADTPRLISAGHIQIVK